jgi:hypothetical protein
LAAVVIVLLLVILALVLILAGLLCLAYARSQPRTDDPEAALALHAIRRRLDVAWLKHKSRVQGQRLRRELNQELGPQRQDETS